MSHDESLEPVSNSPAEIEWDDFYCNPDDKTILRSSDKVHFRISSIRLSHASTMFAGMFETAKLEDDADMTLDEPREIIDIPYPCWAVEIFLDLCSVSQLYVPTSRFSTLRQLYEMAEFYDCIFLPQITEGLKRSGERCPEELFIFASKKNNYDLGRFALKLLPGEDMNSGEKLWNFLERVESGWQIKLQRLVFVEETFYVRTVQMRVVTVLEHKSWAGIADQFVE